MLLTNWLKSIANRCRSPRTRYRNHQRRRFQTASLSRSFNSENRQLNTIESLEDRTMLTSTFDIDMNGIVTEGDSGTKDVILTVTRTGTNPGDLNSAVTVDYATQDDTAKAAENDYLAVSGTLSFSADPNTVIQTQTITVQVNGDQLGESSEEFWVILDNIQADNSDVTFEDDRRNVYIQDDDQVQLSINDATVDEGAGHVTLTVSLDLPTDDILNVDYTTTAGLIATSPEDFEQTSGTLIFLPGETSKELYVNIIDNQSPGYDAPFYVQLSNLQSGNVDAVIADDSAVVTITDNDREFRDLHYDFEYKSAILPYELTQDYSRFGSKIAADGDTMITTAPYLTQEGLVRQGAAFVYVRNDQGTPLDYSDDTWEYQATLLAPDPKGLDYFGLSVAISGDTAVIGAPNAKNELEVRRGAVYVFTRTGTTWSLQQKLDSDSDALTNYHFGSEVAIEGDTILVGVTYYNNSSELVSVFNRSNGIWSYSQSIYVPYTQMTGVYGDEFNSTFLIEGNTIVIGNPKYNNGAGQVHIFRLVNEQWTLSQTLPPPAPSVGAQFSFSVSLEDDLLLIGEPGLGESSSDLGNAYLYQFNQDTDLYELNQSLDYNYLTHADESPHFGTQVLLQDGMMFILSITDPFEDDLSGNSLLHNGTVTQFKKVDSEWVFHTEFWTIFEDEEYFQTEIGFAHQMAFAGGGLFINAPFSDELGDYTGAVYYFGPRKPRIEVKETSFTEGDNGSQWMTVEVTRTGYNPGDLSQSATIDFTTRDGTATLSGGDYQATSGTLSFYGDPTALTQSQFFTVQITGDTLVEADEYFWVDLSNATGAAEAGEITSSSEKMTINEDDHATLSISPDISVNEDAGTVMLTVSLDKPVETEVTVDYETAANSATAGSDFSFKSGRLTFAPGVMTQTITLNIIDSAEVELDESFLVNLSNIQAGGAYLSFADDQAEITILDDDEAQISINDRTLYEYQGNAVLTVSLTQPVGADMSIDFTTTDVSALASEDYVSTSGTLEFHAGDQSKTITIPLINTNLVELQESFHVTLSNLQTNGLNVSLADDQADVTIYDNDLARLIINISSLNTSSDSLDEAVGNAQAIIHLDAPVDTVISVDYSTIDGTATQPDDYQSVSGTLVFLPSEEAQSQTVQIPIIDSDLVEGLEFFLVSLSNLQASGRNVTIETPQKEVRIGDNDRALITINDTIVDEDAGIATLTVSLDQPVETAVTLDYSTLSSSASAVTDFVSSSGSLTISPGYLTQTINIPLVDAPEVELQEKFRVNLSNIQTDGANVIFADSQGEVTINDNDQAGISVQDLVVDENTGVAAVTVSLDKPVNANVSVHYSTLDLSATQSEDYLSRSGTLIFNAGVQTQTIYIPLINSSLVEADQDFLVRLSDLQASGRDVVFAKQEAVITIADDEQAVLTISNVTVNESVGNITLTVTLEGNLENNISVDYTTVDLSASSTEDYLSTAGTLTFTPQNDSRTITVSIVDSDLVEGDETFLIELSNIISAGQQVQLVREQSVITIEDNDQATLTIDDITVNEDAGLAMVTVSLDQPVQVPILVDVATADQTTSAVTDYRSTSGTLAFYPGELTKTVTIALIDSPQVESDETFLVNLSNLNTHTADVTLIKSQGRVTITDDDQATISIDDITIDEGAGNAILTVTLNQPVDTTVTVDFNTVDQSAVQGEDYQSTTGTITFGPDEQTQTITIPLIDSERLEMDETFLVNLTNLQAGSRPVTIGDAQAEVRIVDRQTTVSIDDVSVDEAAGTATLTVTLDRPVDTGISVDYATVDQSAIDSDDYTAVSGTLNFAAGEVSKTITVSIFDSLIVEGNETFLVDLTNLQSSGRNVIFTDNQARVTIQDENPVISIDDVMVYDRDTDILVTVTLDQAVANPVSVDYATQNYTAFDNSNYFSTSGTLTFNPGELTQSFYITPKNASSSPQPDRIFLVNLTNIQSDGTEVLFADDQADITLVGDEPPTISIDDLVIEEGDDGFHYAIFTVTRTGKKPGDLNRFERVEFTATEGTAKPGEDYIVYPTAFYFQHSNELVQTETVRVRAQILGDEITEYNKTFQVILTGNSADGIIIDGIATATIQNDDKIELTIDDVTVDESSRTATLNVSLSGTFSDTDQITFDYDTLAGTAFEGTDYTRLTGTGSISAGASETTLTINLTGNELFEFDRYFDVVLSNFQLNGLDINIADSQARVTIQNYYGPNSFELQTKLSPNLSDPPFRSFGTNFATDGDTFISIDPNWQYDDGLAQFFIRNDQGTPADFSDDTWEFLGGRIQPDQRGNYLFGSSLAIEGDIAVFGAVVAPDAPDDPRTGVVYVFEKNGEQYQLRQTLTPSDASGSFQFGATVAIEGETIIVGDPGDESSEGAVFVFSRSGGVWSESAKLTATTPAPQSNFGSSVDIDNSTIVIGAQNDAEAGFQSGAVYIATLVNGEWTVTQKLQSSQPHSEAHFGTSVSIQGNTLVVGAVDGRQDSLTRSAAYVFILENGVWQESKILQADQPVADTAFGADVLIQDDQILIKSYAEPGNPDGNNVIHAFLRIADDWVSQGTISAPASSDQIRFGSSLGIANGTIYIGASEDNGGEGTIHLFRSALKDLSVDRADLVQQPDGSKLLVLEVTRTAAQAGGLKSPAIIDFSTFNIGDSSGLYQSLEGTLYFNGAPNSVSQTETFVLQINGAVPLNLDSTFTIALSQRTGSDYQPQTVSPITIVDNPPALSIDDVSVSEADDTATLTVSLNQALTTVVTVDYSTFDQSAFAGMDYQQAAGTLTFAAGEQTKTITVSLIDSDLVEFNETLLVNLTNLQSGGAAVYLGDSEGLVTITDDDQATLSINDVTVNEDAETATLTVSLDRAVDGAIYINYATLRETASNPEDFLSQSGILYFNSGELSQTVTIDLLEDDIYELTESFVVTLSQLQSGGLNVVVPDPQGQIEIIDNEPLPDYWLGEKILPPGDPMAGLEFGNEMDVDGNLLITSPRGFQSIGDEYVAAYIYTNWTHTATLTVPASDFWSPTAQAYRSEPEFAGFRVAINGDTAVVAANNYRGGLSDDTAVVYRFKLSDGVWSLDRKIGIDNTASGNSTARSGISVDINKNWIVIGTPGTNRVMVLGDAYNYLSPTNRTWNLDQYIGRPDSYYRNFGSKVVLQDSTLVVTSSLDSSGLYNTEGAFVYEFSNHSWSLTQKLIPNDPAESDFSVTSIDIDGDRIVVGTINQNAYVFTRDTATNVWAESHRFTPTDFQMDPPAWTNVQIYGSRIVISSATMTEEYGSPETLTLYKLENDEWVEQIVLTSPDAEFSSGIAFYNSSTVFFSSPSDDEFAENQGAIHAYWPIDSTVYVRSVEISESDQGIRQARVAVIRRGNLKFPAQVDFSTSDGSATLLDGDYAALSGTLMFPEDPVALSQMIEFTIDIYGDTKVEEDEYFNIDLSNPRRKRSDH